MVKKWNCIFPVKNWVFTILWESTYKWITKCSLCIWGEKHFNSPEMTHFTLNSHLSTLHSFIRSLPCMPSKASSSTCSCHRSDDHRWQSLLRTGSPGQSGLGPVWQTRHIIRCFRGLSGTDTEQKSAEDRTGMIDSNPARTQWGGEKPFPGAMGWKWEE